MSLMICTVHIVFIFSSQSNCFFFQKMVTCVASEPKCGGELIEKLRYWVLQIAMMDSILGTCKDIDYNTLKSVVQESGLLNFV